MREFIEAAKKLNESIVEEGDVHELAPDVGAVFQVLKDDGTVDSFAGHPHTYRVNGWLKAAPPPLPEPDIDNPNTSFRDVLDHILDSGNREFDMGRGKTRLMWCTRRDAEYVSGSGVSGIIKPIDKIKVVGRVNWPKDVIDRERAGAMRRVGEIVF